MTRNEAILVSVIWPYNVNYGNGRKLTLIIPKIYLVYLLFVVI